MKIFSLTISDFGIGGKIPDVVFVQSISAFLVLFSLVLPSSVRKLFSPCSSAAKRSKQQWQQARRQWRRLHPARCNTGGRGKRRRRHRVVQRRRRRGEATAATCSTGMGRREGGSSTARSSDEGIVSTSDDGAPDDVDGVGTTVISCTNQCGASPMLSSAQNYDSWRDASADWWSAAALIRSLCSLQSATMGRSSTLELPQPISWRVAQANTFDGLLGLEMGEEWSFLD
ncbi:hypothetical protein Taro_008633 [Colocasia esculenta]|uniref:Uncharacterized protein n=1 Tax=Colocasia esculenta TaxID=4460 RepID=A0A843TXQ0_COLES|nr:hypothetical protein [Colocasia esculenta]